jgi:uncharacterized protein YprB with RNaseH-like and TPR domain
MNAVGCLFLDIEGVGLSPSNAFADLVLALKQEKPKLIIKKYNCENEN